MNDIIISGFADEISLDFDEQLETVTSLGMNYICIRSANKKGIADFTVKEIEDDIKPKLDKKGIKVSSIGSAIGKVPVDDEAAFQTQLVQLDNLCKIAKVLDCRYIRIFSFFVPEGQNPEDQKDVVVEKLKKFIEVAKKNDVILIHENEKGIFGDTGKRCLYLFDKLECDHFKAAFDFANFVQCDDDPEECWNMLKDKVVYIHIKDAEKETKENVVVGSGDGKVEMLLKRAIREDNYKGFLTLEPHLVNFAFFAPGKKAPVVADHLIGKQARNGKEGYTMQYNALKEILSRI
ncbi:MAG: sugar phosphate isomerase/epimerase [Butyrivibrio sp.]|uniref:sugar phosphate isomerase/epimerase family protein n=1 Tax=Butyrivibrio sp. TaxID=28121 RepID=UPI0025F1E021|nr:sugar phosphate isomerase/epimerase family protein [Butyrivibrio sp.]MCR5770387.1 sugar phosphate isomerase/epimerase [Butyrivibrio sp.]